MKFLDLSLKTPEENLACDEALLDLCEQSQADEILRFWEPDSYFVVLGYSNRVQSEVHREACQERGIPIYRRISGGGTVLQGPGCLNYSLFLRIQTHKELSKITETNRWVLEKHQKALSSLKEALKVQGISDLTFNHLKFSGNAQRRKKKFVLFHGTFLLHFDLSMIEKTLLMPLRQPDYRKQRAHQDFVTNLEIPSKAIKETLINCWGADSKFEAVPNAEIQTLIQTRYSQESWNYKF